MSLYLDLVFSSPLSVWLLLLRSQACLASASLGYLLVSPFLSACCVVLVLLGWRCSLQLHLDLDLLPE